MSRDVTRVLCGGSLPGATFTELVDAASAAGFDAVTIWPHHWRRGVSREGLAAEDMRRLLDDRGLRVTDVETCWDWLPPQPGAEAPATPVKALWGREQLFEVADALGATTVVAAHLTGGEVCGETAAEGFASLCDDAAGHGLTVALEYVPFTGLRTLGEALDIVETAGRPNGGIVVDVCHHARGGGDESDLGGIPAARLLSVQLADAPAAAPPDLLQEAMFGRRLPGAGELDVAGALAALRLDGSSASVGIEVYQDRWAEIGPMAAAGEMFESVVRVLPTKGPRR